MDNTEIAMAKFNGDGFFTWQMKSMYTLMRKGLWELIEPNEDSESSPSTLDNHKALGIIAQGLGDEVIHHIAGIKNAKLAWEQLNNLFGSETKSSKMNLLMQFYLLNKNESHIMTAHINKFKALKQ